MFPEIDFAAKMSARADSERYLLTHFLAKLNMADSLEICRKLIPVTFFVQSKNEDELGNRVAVLGYQERIC